MTTVRSFPVYLAASNGDAVAIEQVDGKLFLVSFPADRALPERSIPFSEQQIVDAAVCAWWEIVQEAWLRAHVTVEGASPSE